ncbi:MAG: FeoB-associated Cys-rich membrane protein [Ruminococcaceae bacterium]|nr:FeoB-associated Cys-rich membrane protein [Oscillospiraceae bacterium]
MNLPTTIGVIIVAVIFVAIVAREIYNRKKGKSSCSCGCSGCAMKDKCHPEK